ncbi:MAG: S24 family peptidase [Sulfurospirillaceae bacterium]|nr:S24 family peptidase [Sulfurospirillaceae bacterium]
MDFTKIAEKIRTYLQQKFNTKIYDSDIAQALNISKEHYSRSKKSNNVPLKSIIEFCAKENIVINYILFDQSPESLIQTTNKLITIKYFKHINTSAGGGALNDNEDFEYLTIDDELVAMLGGENRLKYIEAVNSIGDSMEPIIKDKAVLFIDRQNTNLLKDKKEIYVLNTPAGILVKRLDITVSGKLKLISENPSYETEIIDIDEVSIIGKVIGAIQNFEN